MLLSIHYRNKIQMKSDEQKYLDTLWKWDTDDQLWREHRTDCALSLATVASAQQQVYNVTTTFCQISNLKLQNPKAPAVTWEANFPKSRYLEMLLNHSKWWCVENVACRYLQMRPFTFTDGCTFYGPHHDLLWLAQIHAHRYIGGMFGKIFSRF